MKFRNPARYAEALALRRLGWTYRRIAKEMAISPARAHQMVFHAERKWRNKKPGSRAG